MKSFKEFLIERPSIKESIEDQIETGNRTIVDYMKRKSKGYALAGNTKVLFDITVDPELPYYRNAAFEPVEGENSVSKIKLTKELDLNDSDVNKKYYRQDFLAHETGHAHQLASRVRDTRKREAQGKSTYIDALARKDSSGQKSSNPKLANLSPELEKYIEYSRYYLGPQEVNARSVGAGTTAYRRRLSGEDRIASFRYPKMEAELGLERRPGGKKVYPEEMSAMTRHERSVAKRKNLFAKQDLRDATARGILKAEQDMATPNPDAEATKARQDAIKSKVEDLKAKTGQPKVFAHDVTPSKGAKIASKIPDKESHFDLAPLDGDGDGIHASLDPDDRINMKLK